MEANFYQRKVKGSDKKKIVSLTKEQAEMLNSQKANTSIFYKKLTEKQYETLAAQIKKAADVEVEEKEEE